MGDFATQNDITAGLTGTASNGGRHVYKKTSITTVAGDLYSSWTVPGWPNPPTTFPTTQAVPTDATVGALNVGMLNAPGGGTLRLLGWGSIQGLVAGTDSIYLRCAHMGGLSTIVTGTQSTNFPIDLTAANAAGLCALDGSDVEWFIEVFAAGGATSPATTTINYTNQAGTGSRATTVTSKATMWPISRLIPITTLQAGDTSIKSIQSIALTTSSGTAGNVGIVAMKRLTMPMYLSSNTSGVYDYAGTTMPVVPPDACLQVVTTANTTTYGTKEGLIVVGSKA